MGGTFNSLGKGNAWRKDPQVELAKQQDAQRKQDDYRARVIGRRVSVTSDVDFGREGEIVDVVDGMLAVRLDGEKGDLCAPYGIAVG